MKRDGRKLDHRTLEEIRRMAPWINQRQLSFHLALSRMTASKILDRRLRVGSGCSGNEQAAVQGPPRLKGDFPPPCNPTPINRPTAVQAAPVEFAHPVDFILERSLLNAGDSQIVASEDFPISILRSRAVTTLRAQPTATKPAPIREVTSRTLARPLEKTGERRGREGLKPGECEG